MSWKLSSPSVKLAVTRFRPEAAPAGLTNEQRTAHRQRRERETRKVEPATDLYEVRMACNVFLYGNFVELVPIVVDPVAPRPPAHACDEIDCVECHNRGLYYGDWLKAKRLSEL